MLNKPTLSQLEISMSEDSPSKVFMFDGEDPDMLEAYQRARSHFRFFWREIIWERHRIVPAFDMACIKAGFFR